MLKFFKILQEEPVYTLSQCRSFKLICPGFVSCTAMILASIPIHFFSLDTIFKINLKKKTVLGEVSERTGHSFWKPFTKYNSVIQCYFSLWQAQQKLCSSTLHCAGRTGYHTTLANKAKIICTGRLYLEWENGLCLYELSLQL